MARRFKGRDSAPILSAAENWIKECLIEDRSVFIQEARWTAPLVEKVYQAFVEHPDFGHEDFMTKLKGQMGSSPQTVQQLAAEMLWALLLFPSNMKAGTKRQQIREVWALSGSELPIDHPLLSDSVLVGIGSGGPGFNNYRPDELTFLIEATRDLKRRDESERRLFFNNYDDFVKWIDTVPRDGSRQFRHMLRFFSFPDRVERMSSNNDRREILKAFGVASSREVRNWSDRQLDEALLNLRMKLQTDDSSAVLDFYESPLRERWAADRKVKTPEGEVTVTVPTDEEESEEESLASVETKSCEVRQSIQIQAKLARIGIVLGFKIWAPRADRSRILELMSEKEGGSFLDSLPLNYDSATVGTVEQIDVLWLKGRFIARAFEVEHTTAVYSGLLRMADLLALQPNMDIRLHIVAPVERREKVMREMLRPVFSLFERGPLSKRCTFISYESVNAISSAQHLAHMNDSIIVDYEEFAGKE